MALQVAIDGGFWSNDRWELNLSFESLRDFQWERLINAIWAFPAIAGPFEQRFIPGKPPPPRLEVKIPQPTDSLTLMGSINFAPGVEVGIEVLVTRSLFECVSISIPVGMFAEGQADETRIEVERWFYDFAMSLYDTTLFSIASLGRNRGCHILLEMLNQPKVLREFLAQGNFLADEDTLVALRVTPSQYLEVRPQLRWCPPEHLPPTPPA